MWAFAIWDAAERRLFLSCDRFGVKPLHYHADRSTFAFASEVKAFFGVEAIHPSFDADGLAMSFALTSTMEGMELTPYFRVRRVLPGHNPSLTERDGSPRITRWWRALDHLPEISPIPARQNERLGERFKQARQRVFDATEAPFPAEQKPNGRPNRPAR